MQNQTVGVNTFVTRQIRGSGKTFSDSMSFEEMANYAEKQLERKQYRAGYREGVILVPVSEPLAQQFVCPFTRITDQTRLTAEVVRRRPEEEPYIRIRALNGTPLPAGKVELVLYHHDVLTEDNDCCTDADWELIAILAVPEGVDEMPMGPVTMMRNQLHLPGGTQARYSSDEWAASIRFWQQVAALEPESDEA